MNANKAKFMGFKQGAISTQTERPKKLVKQFTYIDRIISSSESDYNIRLAKAWTVFNR